MDSDRVRTVAAETRFLSSRTGVNPRDQNSNKYIGNELSSGLMILQIAFQDTE